MRAVEIGSSAEHGSSISSTSGSTASARATHRRCCWPPERLAPGAAQAFLDLVPQRRLAQARSRRSGRAPAPERDAIERQARGHVVLDRHGRKRRRLLKHHPDPPPHLHRIDARRRRCPSRRAALRPSARAPGTTSCIRLRHRTSVDLPHPEGPMIAVITFAGNARLMSWRARSLAEISAQMLCDELFSHGD